MIGFYTEDIGIDIEYKKCLDEYDNIYIEDKKCLDEYDNIGIDIEYKKCLDEYDNIAKLVFAEKEKRYINSGNKRNRFYKIWHTLSYTHTHNNTLRLPHTTENCRYSILNWNDPSRSKSKKHSSVFVVGRFFCVAMTEDDNIRQGLSALYISSP